MMYRTYILCFVFLLVISASRLMGQERSIENELDQNRPPYFRLLSPEKNFEVVQSPLKFTWENKEDLDSPNTRVSHYEVAFWSESQLFREIFQVIPSYRAVETLEFEDYRKVFRRHGKYYWKVTAYDINGNQTSSEVWTFSIGIPDMEEEFTTWTYIYAIQFQYNHRMRTDDYVSFLQNVNPNAHMKSYSELNFIFHQENFPIPSIELEEKVSLLSQVGLGAEITSRIRLLRNLYFSICPYGSFESSWYSTGLQDYTNTMMAGRLGGEVFLMPKGFVSFKMCWIPRYHVRYIEKEGGLRTFLGKGWEYGIRIIISNAVIKVFRLFGVDIDFQRIPFEFHFSEIKDQYSGTLLRMRCVSVGYLFQ
ncbi:hypothetical protein JW824_03830 [bacterium]|nr:hypothetical protein [bacterium]